MGCKLLGVTAAGENDGLANWARQRYLCLFCDHRKGTTGSLEKGFGEFNGCAILTASCLSNHYIPVQKFVSVAEALSDSRSPLMLNFGNRIMLDCSLVTKQELSNQGSGALEQVIFGKAGAGAVFKI